jgi:glycosyltransferase involved in cell wall biosynthesis
LQKQTHPYLIPEPLIASKGQTHAEGVVMTPAYTASVIINNYNYGRFLPDAIESALAQTHSRTEVIVVDDGSNDESRKIIARYTGRITPVLKQNGGQGSSFNAGFAVSRGEVVLFLDADDILLPTAVASAVERFDRPEIVKVHWRLQLIDEQGRKMGGMRPSKQLPQGDLREAAFRLGPTNHLSAPTSGNAWSRTYLERVLPIPEDIYFVAADTYLFELAPFFGIIRTAPAPLSLWRKHGQNDSAKPVIEKLRLELLFYDNCCEVLSRHFVIGIKSQVWRRYSWWHRLELAIQEIAALPKFGGGMILVDDATWDLDHIDDRSWLPFLERDGAYWGNPSDDETAIQELERMRRSGATLLIFVWPAFWWFEYYTHFYNYIRTRFTCLLDNERLVAFDLARPLHIDTTP